MHRESDNGKDAVVQRYGRAQRKEDLFCPVLFLYATAKQQSPSFKSTYRLHKDAIAEIYLSKEGNIHKMGKIVVSDTIGCRGQSFMLAVETECNTSFQPTTFACWAQEKRENSRTVV